MCYFISTGLYQNVRIGQINFKESIFSVVVVVVILGVVIKYLLYGVDDFSQFYQTNLWPILDFNSICCDPIANSGYFL